MIEKVTLSQVSVVQGKMRINPLSPYGDQHQFSPKDIHTLSRD